MLRDIPVDPTFNLDQVVRRTDGLSGSDLKEACRSTYTRSNISSMYADIYSSFTDAAMIPVREYIRENKLTSGDDAFQHAQSVRLVHLDKYKSRG